MKATYLSLGRDLKAVYLLQDGYHVPNLVIVSFVSGHQQDGTWQGEICIERTSGDLEKMVSADPVFWITVIVQEEGGSQTTYHYPEAKLVFREAGSWASQQLVSQRIVFTSPIRSVI